MSLYDPDNPTHVAQRERSARVMQRYDAELAAMTPDERAQHYADGPQRWREACRRAGVVSRV